MTRTHQELYDDFINGRLPEGEWTHEAHLVACWMTLTERTPREALSFLRDSITTHNCGVGTVNSATSGYHETLTVYYITAVHFADAASPEDLFDDVSCGRGAPLEYWSREFLFTPDVRLNWVEPDLGTLPWSVEQTLTPLRWAVLGTGFISNTMVEAIQQSPTSSLDVMVGRNAVAVDEFCERFSIPRAVYSYETVMADPEIDVLYVGLPNHVHAEIAIAAATQGKAVVSEKSLTTTMRDADALVAAVREHDTFFVEGLMYLAHPVIRRFVELLSDGRLGELRSVRASYAANIAHLVNPDGMGTLYNLGCYPVSLLHLVVQTMLGEDAFADRTIAAVGNLTQPAGTVVDASLSVRFGNGVLASVQSSDRYGNASEFSVSGENGTLRFVTNPWLPVAGTNELRWEPFDGQSESIVVTDTHDAFYHQVRMVERHLRMGDQEAERPSPRLADSLEIMKLLTDWEVAVRASLRA